MSQTTRTVCEPLPSETCDLYASPPEPPAPTPRGEEPHRESRSRISLKRYILDPVLPMLTVLSMSVLTVVMLVMIVTAVADMDLRLPDNYVSVDPWLGVPLDSAPFSREAGTYAGYVAPATPREDPETWPAPPLADPF